MKTKKIIALILSFFLLFALIAGCDAQIQRLDNPASVQESESVQEPDNPVSMQETGTPETPGGDTHPGAETTAPGDTDDMPGNDAVGQFSGTVREGRFYHDGQGEWLTYYFTDVGETQFETLKERLAEYEDFGQLAETEIQLYSVNISLKDYIGKQITFGGEPFEAHTMHHRRNIVFEVKEIYSVSDLPSGYSAHLTYQALETPLLPRIVEHGMPCWFNGFEVKGHNFDWAELNRGERCLMILVDAEEPHGGANDLLYLPGYGTPKVSRVDEYIYLKWTNPEYLADSFEETVELMFVDGESGMAVLSNALKGVRQGPETDVIDLPYPLTVYSDESAHDMYFVPLYAILNEIGGGVLIDTLNIGAAYIYSGEPTYGEPGFWETSDRGEYRTDAVIDGVSHSIASYWSGLELRPDGTFTESTRYYQDEGDWVLRETTGSWFFSGRILVMRYEAESMWRGVNYTALAPFEPEEPDVGYVYGWYIEDWNADYLSFYGRSPLYANLTERGEAAPRPGKTPFKP